MTAERNVDAPVSGAPLRVALLGCGVVGTAVAQRLVAQAADFAARAGRPLEIVGVAVRREGVDRSATGLDESLFTTDAEGLVARADLVVELMGGIEPARRLILAALERGTSVVTANKALMAREGAALHEAAHRAGADLYYEAAVAGAIPIVRPLVESLAGDDVHRIIGIVNGTTNYVLDQMDREGAEFDDALKQAQALGYAEADPTADVESHDAAAKAAILASLAFHSRVRADQVHREGITGVTAADVREARELDCVIKPLAICERVTDESGRTAISARVYPAMVPRSHPLASVHGAFNAIFVEAAAAGELMFYGQGAGGAPTSSAVLGDVIAAARHIVAGARGPGESAYADLPVLALDSVQTRYHISLDVEDRPGVLARVAAVFSDHEVSIESVRQRLVEGDDGAEQRASLVVVTHGARDAALAATTEALAADPSVRRLCSVIRVEGGL